MRTAIPKPNKADRQEAKKQLKQSLKEYRAENAARAVLRDNDQCVFCWFLKGKVTPRADVHHVYSRGKKSGDWREHYTHMLCTCKQCHPQPIKQPGSSEKLAWIEQVMYLANTNPINPDFK